jgi:hypothetical protein
MTVVDDESVKIEGSTDTLAKVRIFIRVTVLDR